MQAISKNNTGIYNEKLTHHIWSPHITMVYIITICVLQKDDQYRVRVQQLVYNNEKIIVYKHYVCWKACRGYKICIIMAQHTIIA